MQKDVNNDLVVSHSLLNYLQSSYQGRFAAANVLSQLGFSTLNADELPAIKERVAKIKGWWDDLWKGNALVSANWERPQTFDSNKAFEWLAELRPDLDFYATTIHAAINKQPFGANPEDVKFLIGALARYAYSRDNYVRGLIELGTKLGTPEIVDQYAHILDEAKEEVAVVHSLLSSFTTEHRSEGFLETLINECIKLPGVFLTHIHDINQLLNVLTPAALTFEFLGFAQEQTDIWKKLGLTPVAAGYWAAHGIPAEDIPAWSQFGLGTPADASVWSSRGFNPRSALPWLQAGFTAHLALRWTRGGASVEQALKAIERGEPPPSLVTVTPILK